MHRIILDFIRRRWWLFPVVTAFAILGLATAQSMIFTHLAIIVLIFDAQRGLLRAVRPLPVSRRSQASAWWFIGVLLAPLVTFFALPIGALISAATTVPRVLPVPTVDAALPSTLVLAPDYFAPWFSAGISAWVGLGYAAFCFLLCIALPNRPASSQLESIWQGVFGGLWGLSFSGPMLFMFALPKNPGAIQPWHWVLFALVPVLLVLSFIGAPDMMARRMFALSAAGKTAASAVPTERGGLTGIPLLLGSVLGRTLLLLVLIVGMQMLVARFLSHGAAKNNPINSIQIVAFAMIFSSIAGELVGLRVLRVLPLSTRQLALLLLFIPVFFGILCGAVLTVASTNPVPPASALVHFLARASVIAGAGTLALSTSLHIASSARLFVLMTFVCIACYTVAFVPDSPLGFFACGSAGIVLGCIVMMRGLRNSSAFYQARSYFGMNIGQQLVGR